MQHAFSRRHFLSACAVAVATLLIPDKVARAGGLPIPVGHRSGQVGRR